MGKCGEKGKENSKKMGEKKGWDEIGFENVKKKAIFIFLFLGVCCIV